MTVATEPLTADVAAIPSNAEMLTAVNASARNLLNGAALGALTERSDARGAMRFAGHLGYMAATGVLVWLAMGSWFLLVPAMALHGVTIVSMFAPMHECVHRTAFASRRANVVVGWIAGVLSFYNSTFYWYFHSWHHRYTQDPARDPELMFPKARSRREYFTELAGLNFWVRRALDYPKLAMGRAGGIAFVPESARRGIAVSMSAQLAIYAAGLLAAFCGWPGAVYYWFLPALLAQPFTRSLLVCEHTGCSIDGNGLTNTRTTLTGFPVRFLMWNMPFHAEHHLYPAIPFHQLPAAHLKVRDRLAHLAPGYVVANRDILDRL